MSRITWGGVGDKIYETGTDRGVYYPANNQGEYTGGVPWNGLTAVSESPSGAEPNKHYADNGEYANILSAEEFSATIEAFTWPDEFEQSDGVVQPVPGVSVGQQNRRPFGFSYRTIIGNDTEGQEFGHKIHLIYGATAAPSEKAYATVSDSTEPTTFSWELSTSPVAVGTIGGVEYRPTATLTISSLELDAAKWAELEDILYGSDSEEPRLPLPSEVFGLFDLEAQGQSTGEKQGSVAMGVPLTNNEGPATESYDYDD